MAFSKPVLIVLALFLLMVGAVIDRTFWCESVDVDAELARMVEAQGLIPEEFCPEPEPCDEVAVIAQDCSEPQGVITVEPRNCPDCPTRPFVLSEVCENDLAAQAAMLENCGEQMLAMQKDVTAYRDKAGQYIAQVEQERDLTNERLASCESQPAERVLIGLENDMMDAVCYTYDGETLVEADRLSLMDFWEFQDMVPSKPWTATLGVGEDDSVGFGLSKRIKGRFGAFGSFTYIGDANTYSIPYDYRTAALPPVFEEDEMRFLFGLRVDF